MTPSVYTSAAPRQEQCGNDTLRSLEETVNDMTALTREVSDKYYDLLDSYCELTRIAYCLGALLVLTTGLLCFVGDGMALSLVAVGALLCICFISNGKRGAK